MKKIYAVAAMVVLLFTIFALYGQHAIYRYPRLTVDPVPVSYALSLDSGLTISTDGAYLKQRSDMRFRAYQPDVSLRLNFSAQDAPGNIDATILLENIHPDALFTVQAGSAVQIQESQRGLLREVQLSGKLDADGIRLAWLFPEKTAYKFMAIGDTGGDKELSWSLQRASELGADFVLHLGDAYYHRSENGIDARMNESKIPVYTANGNHDFLGPDGNAIETFLQDIGPLNARFSLLGNCFINLDTGAYMYPPHKGARAGLLAAEKVNHRRYPGRCKQYIVFTHRPMVDQYEAEFPQRTHSLHGFDARPLLGELQQLGDVTVLAGHIHYDFQFQQDGLKTYVVGSGLAHRDLILGGHYARVLIGEIGQAGQPAKFSWALNNMPMEYHCSKKIYRDLLKNNSPQARAVHDACGMLP